MLSHVDAFMFDPPHSLQREGSINFHHVTAAPGPNHEGHEPDHHEIIKYCFCIGIEHAQNLQSPVVLVRTNDTAAHATARLSHATMHLHRSVDCSGVVKSAIADEPMQLSVGTPAI